MVGSAETNGAKEAKGGRAVIIIIILFIVLIIVLLIVLIIVHHYTYHCTNTLQIQTHIKRRTCCQQENSQINCREALTYDLNPSEFSQTFTTASLSATDLANPAWL